jgi:hypothetical protein
MSMIPIVDYVLAIGVGGFLLFVFNPVMDSLFSIGFLSGDLLSIMQILSRYVGLIVIVGGGFGLLMEMQKKDYGQQS